MHISSDIRSLDLKNLEKILIKQKFKKYRAIQINDWLIKTSIVSSFKIWLDLINPSCP